MILADFTMSVEHYLFIYLFIHLFIHFIFSLFWRQVVVGKPDTNSDEPRYNPGRNIWNKMEKSSKTGQEKRSLVSFLRVF